MWSIKSQEATNLLFVVILKALQAVTNDEKLSCDMTKPTSAQSDQSSMCAHWVAKYPNILHADSEDWSDWADAQADLSLRWAHSHSVGFVMPRLINDNNHQMQSHGWRLGPHDVIFFAKAQTVFFNNFSSSYNS